MNPYSMPTARDFSFKDRDWADRVAADIIGSIQDGQLQDMLRRDFAQALRRERNGCSDVLETIACAQLDDGTAKIVRACAAAIINR